MIFLLRRKIYDVGVLRRREEKSKYEKNIVSLRCGHVNQYAG